MYNKSEYNPSHFCRYLSISLHGTTLKKWHFDTMKSSLYAAYIIIMSCHKHGYPWPSLSTSPYHSSPPAGLQSYIPYHHIAAVCMFELVVLLLIGHMRGSTGAYSLTISSLLLVRLACIVFVTGGRWQYSWRLVGCCCQDLFNIAHNILV